jgi:hypothetical protein
MGLMGKCLGFLVEFFCLSCRNFLLITSFESNGFDYKKI